MENKMTDNEIKKALKCCVCFEVPFCNKVNLGELALDLINRLEADNKKLTSLCTSKDVIINSQEAEIERMREISEALDIEHEAIKNCAVKEFADRLKAICYYRGGDGKYLVFEDELDVLVKETVGE